MKVIIFIITCLLFYSCSFVDNSETIDTTIKNSCDFLICENGRITVDTITNEIGQIFQKGQQFYIEVTGNAPEPDTIFISCLRSSIELPNSGSYVIFSGYVKDACTFDEMVRKDRIQLNTIDIIYPTIQEACLNGIIIGDQFDRNKIDDDLTIHHLSIENDCLNILISYKGNCENLPELSLHTSSDIKFGYEIDVLLQGEITNNCTAINFALLKYNLIDLKEIFEVLGTELYLHFLNQGFLRIGYRFD